MEKFGIFRGNFPNPNRKMADPTQPEQQKIDPTRPDPSVLQI